MMAPVCFVAWVIVVLLSTLLLYVGLRLLWLRRRSGGSSVKPYARLTDADADETIPVSKWPSSRTGGSGDVEMAGAAAATAGSSHSRHSQ
jgi:hypothetical protein